MKSNAASKPQSESSVAATQPKPPYPADKLEHPGLERELEPKPHFEGRHYQPAGKLSGLVALITGGDSGIGRSVAVLYAREGADVMINCLQEELADAALTRQAVESHGRRCEIVEGDLTRPEFCRQLVERCVQTFGRLDILVSNAAYQIRKPDLESISTEEWDRTFQTNVYAMFHLAQAALPHLKPGSSILVTSSQTGLFGSEQLLDYSATKGAINAFVKALAQNVLDRGIRVNAIAPGPVWTPLNPADPGLDPENVSEFGAKTPMNRPAQPEEIAPAFVFLASNADSSYITGHVLPLLGGNMTTS